MSKDVKEITDDMKDSKYRYDENGKSRDNKDNENDDDRDERRHRKKEKKSKERRRDDSRDRKHRRKHHDDDLSEKDTSEKNENGDQRKEDDKSSSRRERDDARDSRRRSPSDDRRRRDRSSRRDRSRSGSKRHRSKSRDRSSNRRRSRSRDNRRRSRSIDRHRSDRRDRSRSRDRKEHSRAREREREGNRKGEDEKKEEETPKVTLKEILAQNPGITVTEALQRLHQINAANALGLGTGILPQMQNSQALNQATKLMREIYIGNMPPGTTVPQLTDFINSTMKKMNLTIPSPFGGPVVSVWISTDGNYAFVELRTVEEASAALNHLGGVPLGGFQLRVGRPKTNSTAQAMNMIGALPLGVGSLLPVSGGTSVAPTAAVQFDAKDVIMVSNLPDAVEESQVRELLEPFGEIGAFNFIKVHAPAQGAAAVLEFVDTSVTDNAVKGLHGIMLGGYQLAVQRVPPHMASLLLIRASNTGVDPLVHCPPSCILRLSNMVSEDDLKDDELYEELKEDVSDECNNYGTVREIIIPRPTGSPGDDVLNSVGNIFVSFTSPEGATRAKNVLSGRTYDGKNVIAVFYPEKLFEQKIYTLPLDFSIERLHEFQNDGELQV